MIFSTKINNEEINAKIFLYKSRMDPKDIFRWGIKFSFLKEHKLNEVPNDYRIFPLPYESYSKEICIKRAIEFLTKLGFIENNNG